MDSACWYIAGRDSGTAGCAAGRQKLLSAQCFICSIYTYHHISIYQDIGQWCCWFLCIWCQSRYWLCDRSGWWCHWACHRFFIGIQFLFTCYEFDWSQRLDVLDLSQNIFGSPASRTGGCGYLKSMDILSAWCQSALSEDNLSSAAAHYYMESNAIL